jgi:hypothetical protein
LLTGARLGDRRSQGRRTVLSGAYRSDVLDARSKVVEHRHRKVPMGRTTFDAVSVWNGNGVRHFEVCPLTPLRTPFGYPCDAWLTVQSYGRG